MTVFEICSISAYPQMRMDKVMDKDKSLVAPLAPLKFNRSNLVSGVALFIRHVFHFSTAAHRFLRRPHCGASRLYRLTHRNPTRMIAQESNRPGKTIESQPVVIIRGITAGLSF
jgi:hypothetical protein